MVAVPMLAGAVLRLVIGVLVDRIGPRSPALIGQVIVICAACSAPGSWRPQLRAGLLLGVILGFAGACFAVALPLASRWYPPEHQGKAMGIAGLGNSGTVLAALFAPMLAQAFGWNNVIGLPLIPLVVVFVVYLVIAKDAPEPAAAKPLADYVEVLKATATPGGSCCSTASPSAASSACPTRCPSISPTSSG